MPWSWKDFEVLPPWLLAGASRCVWTVVPWWKEIMGPYLFLRIAVLQIERWGLMCQTLLLRSLNFIILGPTRDRDQLWICNLVHCQH